MIFPSLQSMAIAFAAGALLSVPLTWYATAEYKDALHTAQISKQKAEAAHVLQQETEKVIAAERKTAKLKDELELQHAKSLEQVNTIMAENKRLARSLGGLRDPGRRESCNGTLPSTGKTPGLDSDPTSEGRLSSEATEFLLEFAAEADRAAIYAQTCHEWAMRQ